MEFKTVTEVCNYFFPTQALAAIPIGVLVVTTAIVSLKNKYNNRESYLYDLGYYSFCVVFNVLIIGVMYFVEYDKTPVDAFLFILAILQLIDFLYKLSEKIINRIRRNRKKKKLDIERRNLRDEYLFQVMLGYPEEHMIENKLKKIELDEKYKKLDRN